MKYFFSLIILISSITTICAQTTLNTVWMKGFGGEGNDDVTESVVDVSGNIYITGKIQGTVDVDPGPAFNTVVVNNTQSFFSKFSPTGTLLWSRNFNGAALAESGGKAIAVDAIGDVYVAGNFEFGIVDFDLTAPGINTVTAQENDMFIAKYTANGSFVWVKTIGTTSANVVPTCMKIDAAGDLLITGQFYQDISAPVNFNPAGPSFTMSTNGNSDGFVAKYNTAGVLQFAIAYGSSQNDYTYGLDVDAANNFYVTGNFQQTADFDPTANTFTIQSNGSEDLYIAKYNSTGTLQWVNGFGDVGDEGGYKIKIDNNNHLVVYGYMGSTSFDADPSTATVTVTKAGTGPLDVFLGKYLTTSGDLVWAKNTGGTSLIYPRALAFDSQNNIYLAGAFGGIADFDFSAAVSNYTAITIGGGDIYLAKYNPSGDFIYTYNFGGGSTGGNHAYGVHVANNNDVILGGTYAAIVNFDPVATNTLTTYGARDIFLNRYSQCITADTPTLTMVTTTMCANGVVTLSVAAGNLNSATDWVWSSVVCGSSAIHTGNSVTVSPVFLTEYFVRGEGGCTSPGACANASVFVTNSKDIVGSVTHSGNPIAGKVILYRYENVITKWDSVTYQNINASGIYTFNAVNSGSFILMASPTDNTLQTTYSPNAIFWKGATPFGHDCINTTSINIDVQAITDLGGGPGVLAGKITEGVGYGQRSNGSVVPGNPIKGLNIKAGRNPGGDVVAQGRTNSSGEYTLTNFPLNVAGEEYFLMVDIPGLDTNGTYRRAIITGSTQYTNLDFVVDSMYIHPILNFVSVKEFHINEHLVSVYPNPSNDVVNIQFEAKSKSEVELQVMDVFGKLIYIQKPIMVDDKFNAKISTSNWNKGIYFVSIRINQSNSRIKLVITD